jgi:hypothetical protein
LHHNSPERGYAVRGSAQAADSFARSPQGVLRTLRDLAFIALAWALLIGIIAYPQAQLVGLLACAIALAFSTSGGRRDVTIEDR